jgi:hypothetical protein
MALFIGIIVWIGIAAGIALLVRRRHHGVGTTMVVLGLWLSVTVVLLLVGVHSMGLTPQSNPSVLHTP